LKGVKVKRVSFALFDSGETILSALVFSTFFPLYITQHVDPKVYSLLYGGAFLLSFVLALQLGKIADRKAQRKSFFILSSLLVSLLCFTLGITYGNPILSFFYNSLLIGFEKRGFTSGMGVASGYVASALSLIFLAQHLEGREVFFLVSFTFLLFLVPSVLFLENPPQRREVRIVELLRERRFILLILSILSLTEVANTLVAMMGIYLREVYQLDVVLWAASSGVI